MRFAVLTTDAPACDGTNFGTCMARPVVPRLGQIVDYGAEQLKAFNAFAQDIPSGSLVGLDWVYDAEFVTKVFGTNFSQGATGS